MRKVAAFIILALAWYFAGMNRQPYVMAAAVCGVLFVALMFIMSRLLKHNMTVVLPKQNNIVYKDNESELSVQAENSSRFPVNKYTVSVNMKYRGEKKGVSRKLSGRADSKKGNSNNTATIFFTSPYSGIIDVSLTKLKVYDYFAIFSSGKKLVNVKEQMVVLPPVRKMNIQMPPFGNYTNEPVAESSSDKKGEDHSEIRLIREYREGDLTRHMHRNYSARTEKIWIKEYQKENDFIFDFFIDSSTDVQFDAAQRDVFYEVVYSVLGNLIEYDVIIRIHYYDRDKGGLVMYEMTRKNELDDFAVIMMKTDVFCSREEYTAVCKTDALSQSMIITASLEWLFNGQLIYKFDNNNAVQELTERYFDLTIK